MVIAPMYLTEIAPIQYRGSFGTLSQFGVVTSILLSQVKFFCFFLLSLRIKGYKQALIKLLLIIDLTWCFVDFGF